MLTFVASLARKSCLTTWAKLTSAAETKAVAKVSNGLDTDQDFYVA